MADTIKILGQLNPSAATDEDLYTVPANASAVTSSITICETGGGNPTIRIAMRPKGGSILTSHYIVYDKTLAANQFLVINGGFTLAQGDIVTVRSSTADVAFSVFGVETTRDER